MHVSSNDVISGVVRAIGGGQVTILSLGGELRLPLARAARSDAFNALADGGRRSMRITVDHGEIVSIAAS